MLITGLISASVGVALMGVAWALRGVFKALRSLEEAHPAPTSASTGEASDVLSRIMALETGFIGLRSEVAEHVERANQAYARARATESSIRRRQESEDSKDDEDPDSQLHLGHGEGGSGNGVHPMHQGMDPGQPMEPLWVQNARAHGLID